MKSPRVCVYEVIGVVNDRQAGKMCNHDDSVAKKSKKQFDDPNYNYNNYNSSHLWEDLPVGPLIEIAKRLINFEDFEAFHLVCTRWYSALRESKCKFLSGGGCGGRQVPWLLLAERQVVQTTANDETYLNLKPCTNLCKGTANGETFLKPCTNSSNGKEGYRGGGQLIRLFFYTLSSQRVREWIIRLPPELNKENIKNGYFFSSHGWLLIVKDGLSEMFLFNPFCSPPLNYIPLPGCPGFRVRKFALSTSPTTIEEDNGIGCVVVIVYAMEKLALWCLGDKDWTCVRCPPSRGSFGYLLDITFFRGHFYFINREGLIFRLSPPEKKRGADFEAEAASKRIIWEPVTNLSGSYKDRSHGKTYLYFYMAYMVVMSDKLLVVVREALYPERFPFFVLDQDYGTSGFRVFEIVVPSDIRQSVKIKEVENLGNRSLFVGENHSFSIEIPYSEEATNTSPPNDSQAQAQKEACYYGCKPNRIYFTDDRLDQYQFAQCSGGKDMGVYNMADGSIEQHFQGQSLSDICPPLWVEPCW